VLANTPVCATLPATDLERTTHFYGTVLGLTDVAIGLEGGVFFEGGEGTMLRV
jgi:catechol 2,3-dioxygenase-like lactoylglutathione lyase family enzyme